ncbi:MAG: sensor domain-containing diguanylate cyclase [bacterium]
MISIDERIVKFISVLGRIKIQEIDIKEIVRLLATNVASQGCFLTFGDQIIYHHSVPRRLLLNNLNEIKGNVYSQELDISGLKYRLVMLFNHYDKFGAPQAEKLKSLLNIISQAISINSRAKERISEFQAINELNLNMITTMDVKKIIWSAESASRRLLDTDKVYLFYLIDAHIVGQKGNYSIKILPEEVFRQLSRSRQIVKLDKSKNNFLKFLLNEFSCGIVLIVPFTIKNQVRGFFLMDDFEKISDPTTAIMRLKFFGNQAAIALERIELFQALNKALQESQGLQEIAKLLLSPYELKYLFNELLRRAQQILGFKKIMCSLYNPATDSFERVHSVGISRKKFREAKKVHPPYRFIRLLMQDRFRISNSYYIPSEEVPVEIRDYEIYKLISNQKRVHNLWLQGDVFISPIYSRSSNLLGILSLAEPTSGIIPDRSKIRLLEAFGDFLGLAIESHQLFEKNVFLSYTDDLTGVYNYRFLKEKLNELLNKNPKSLAIAMIDLDLFKDYNDQFGHLAGDLLLKDVSQTLKKVVKDGYVTRYGGDEFIVILPDAGTRAIQRRINEVRRILALSKNMQFSCGVAAYPIDGKDFGTLIDCADKRLYQEKRAKYDKAKT